MATDTSYRRVQWVHDSTTGAGSLLGRDEDVAGLTGLLERARLITLCGAPGTGKSRLAFELAAQLAERYPDGVALVELASLGDGALVPSAVASALSLHEVPGQSLTDILLGRLRRRRCLLVLDNCEHLVDACAELVGALGDHCPDLRMLATSREPLHAGCETVWDVRPLPVPEPEAHRPEVLIEYAAVRLFVERAAAARPGFGFNAYVGPAVAEICRRLDGLPLAIELAASRVESLTPPEIARRLGDRCHLLGSASGSGPAHHETLEAALDWSHELLCAPERSLLRRLSVFSGSFDLDTAAAVCCGGEVQGEQVPELLDRLAVKSLVAAGAGDGRHRLLQTIRAYAGARLDAAGEAASLREAHARFYLRLAEEAEPELTGADQVNWLDRLEVDHAELRAALEWALGQGRGEWALRLAGALVLFWRVRGHFSEGRELLGGALAASDGGSAELEARALWGSGFMTLMSGDVHAAKAILADSLSAYRVLGDPRGAARALLLLGDARLLLEDPMALAALEESATLAREAQDAWCLAHALGVAARVHASREQHGIARALFEESIGVARAAGDIQGLRYGLLGLGELLGSLGDFRGAEPLLEEAVSVLERLGEVYFKATALTSLGQLAFGRGEFDRARETLDAALALARLVGRPDDQMVPLIALARVALTEADTARARAFAQEAAGLARASGRVHARRQAMEISGEVAAYAGELSAARRFYDEALDLARSEGNALGTAQALSSLGQLALVERNVRQAATLHGEALRLLHGLGDARGVADTLQSLAGLAAEAGRCEEAACVLGAAAALYERNGYAESPWQAQRWESDLTLLRQSLRAEDFEAAWALGRHLPLEEAVELASTPSVRARQATTGWGSLTEAEWQVAALVAEHMTNAEIAEQLFLAAGTVKNRLSQIFSKLGMRRRRELAQEFRRRGQGHQAFR